MAITRYLSAASIGLLATTSLLFLMQLLIDIGHGAAVEPITSTPIVWIAQPIVETVAFEEKKPERFKKPEPVPSDPRPITEAGGHSPGWPNFEPPRPSGEKEQLRPGEMDGPLITVIKVQPNYPARAILKGLSGHVTVRYDVLATGAVSNVTVVESSHSVFDEAAIEAAYRFRYKPRIVDGVAMETHGVQNRFVFQLEN